MELFSPELPFWKGNLHTHTTRSDGRKTPEEVCALYRQAGYDFLALTDHRLVGGETFRDGSLLVLSGLEMDYALPHELVHIVGVGVDPQAMAAYRYGNADPQPDIDLVRAAGGRYFLCHPAWSLNTQDTMRRLRGLTGVEIYNTMSGLPWNAARADSSALLDVLFAGGCLLPVTAADDAHFYTGEQCVSYLMVQAELCTWPCLRAALDAGRFYATQGPRLNGLSFDGKTLRVLSSPVSRVTFYSDLCWVAGRTRVGDGLTESEYEVQPGETFVRVELADEAGRRAWCSPIAISAKEREQA